ncbi:MAG TPA: subclass B1 metallo-beta-lactamase [Bacteroidales bacterium]|nr:subclass B1 metallo-beta-lactamase [Bacteroidales bacterium]
MKKIIVALAFAFNAVSAFSQEIIRISPDVELMKLSENAYVHVSYTDSHDFGRYSSNGLVFINGHEAFLFDTPPGDSLTGILCSYLEQDMNLIIRAFVPNHWHEDCMGGLRYIKGRHIPSYANQNTIDIARSHRLPLPEHGFVDSLNLMLGGKSVLCWFPGAAHSMDNIVVWIPSEKILFAGCMCKSANSDNLGNVADGDPAEYAATIEKVIAKFSSVKIVIPGHGLPGGPELLSHTRTIAKR